MNENFHRELTHIAFSPVEDAAHLMHYLGPDTLLVKMNISEGYRLVPIHQGVCIQWQNAIYVDCELSFGLALAPAIFSAPSEALEWVLRKRGV